MASIDDHAIKRATISPSPNCVPETLSTTTPEPSCDPAAVPVLWAWLGVLRRKMNL